MALLFPIETDEEKPRRKPPVQFTRMVHTFGGKARTRMLERDEELDLILAWQERGDPDAMESLFRAYDGWLKALALRTCTGRGHADAAEDAYGVAVLGFIRSCGKFDPARDARISTFSRYHIVGKIVDHLNRSNYPVSVGTSSNERVAQHHRKMLLTLFREETGRDWGATRQDADILARLSGLSASALLCGLAIDDMNTTPVETLEVEGADAPDADLSRRQAAALVAEEVDRLRTTMSKRDFTILTRFFEDGADDPAVNTKLARQFRITPERVGQIRRAALGEIRDHLRRNGVHASHDILG